MCVLIFKDLLADRKLQMEKIWKQAAYKYSKLLQSCTTSHKSFLLQFNLFVQSLRSISTTAIFLCNLEIAEVADTFIWERYCAIIYYGKENSTTCYFLERDRHDDFRFQTFPQDS